MKLKNSRNTGKIRRVYQYKLDTALDYFGGYCDGCQKKYDRGFTFHHRSYIFGEKTYRDFKNTVDYNEYIIPIVRKDPARFNLLCMKCHRTVSKLKLWKKENLLKILLIVFSTE